MNARISPIAATTALCLLFAAPSATAQAPVPNRNLPEVRWDLSLWGASRAVTQPGERWAAAMKQRTGGKWEIKLHFGATLSQPRDNVDGIRSGLFQMAMQCPTFHPGKTPLSTVYDLPFAAVNSIRVQTSLLDAIYRHPNVADEMLRRWNAVHVLPLPTPAHSLISVKPIRDIADFRGLRASVPGGVADVLTQFGMVQTLLDASESYVSLDQGILQAVSFPHTYAHSAFRLHEVAKSYMLDLPLGTAGCDFVANATEWRKLPAEWIKIHEDYVKNELTADFEKTYSAAIVKDIGKDETCGPGTTFGDAGVKCIRFPADSLRKLVQASDPLYKKWIEANQPNGKKLFDFMISTRDQLAASK